MRYPTLAMLIVLWTLSGWLAGDAIAQMPLPPVGPNATADEAANPASVSDAKLGSIPNVHQCGGLFTSGQLSQTDLASLGQQQIKRIISLRTEGEIDWDEAGETRQAGIEFVAVPFRTPESLTDEVFDNIRKLLKDKSKATLFHCGSANRVGGVWLPYRVLDEGVPLDVALKEAKLIGLKTEFIQEKAIDYIRRQQAEDTPAEASVNPGINESFTNPELNVDEFVKRFEIESREVFVARDQIIEACQVKPGQRVADVGAGTGLFSRMFARQVGDQGWVYAVDIAPRFVEHITRDASQAGVTNLTAVLCAENSINLPPESVDLVFVCDTYHHFEFPHSTLTSIFKALKPGGELVVIDFDRVEGTSRPWLISHVRAGKDVFRAEIQDAGFELVGEPQLEAFKENYLLRFRKP